MAPRPSACFLQHKTTDYGDIKMSSACRNRLPVGSECPIARDSAFLNVAKCSVRQTLGNAKGGIGINS